MVREMLQAYAEEEFMRYMGARPYEGVENRRDYCLPRRLQWTQPCPMTTESGSRAAPPGPNRPIDYHSRILEPKIGTEWQNDLSLGPLALHRTGV